MITCLLPLLLQSLMTGLMYNQPEDHITYLQDCLKKLQDKKPNEAVAWNQFVAESKPLPPIASESKNGNRSSSRETGFSDHVPPDKSRPAGTHFIHFAAETELFNSLVTTIPLLMSL